MFGFGKKVKAHIWVKKDNAVHYVTDFEIIDKNVVKVCSISYMNLFVLKGYFTIGEDATFDENIANMWKLEFKVERQKERISNLEQKLEELEKKLNGRKKK